MTARPSSESLPDPSVTEPDAPASPVFKEIGVDYCRLHFGTRNEDDSYWDLDDNLACDQRDDDETTPCVLVPLGYIALVDQETDDAR